MGCAKACGLACDDHREKEERRMMDYNLRIGLVPVRRDVTPRPGIFNWEKAEARGRLFTKKIEEAYSDDRISFSRIDGINKEDLLYSEPEIDYQELVKQQAAEAEARN